VEPLVPSATRINDYTGARERWVSGAATWQEVQYRGLYPGIDLLFYGNSGEIEYDARIQPGADPASIAFAWEGTRPPRVTAYGDLMIPVGEAAVTWRKPAAYQTIGDRRVPVKVWFTVAGRRIGFGVRGWDRRYPLVIDPTLSFSTYLGGGWIGIRTRCRRGFYGECPRRRYHQFGRLARHRIQLPIGV